MRAIAGLTAAAMALATTLVVAPTSSAATLSPPSSVSVTVASTSVAVGEGRVTGSWGAVSGALAYAMSARTGGVVVATTTVTAPVTSATLTGLTGGVTYDIVVQTGNSDGFGSASTPVQATALTVPSAPAITSVTQDASTTTVTWSEPSNGGAAITSYSITQGPSGTPVSVAAPTTSYTFSNTTFPATSDYSVTATNAVGTSSTGSATTTTPSAPRSLLLTGSSSSITASWQTPASTGGAAISAYVVSLVQSGSVVSSSTVTDLANLQATFSGLSPGTFQVQVVARNSNGSGLPASSSITLTASGATTQDESSPSSGTSTSVVTDAGTTRPSANPTSPGTAAPGSGAEGQSTSSSSVSIALPARFVTRAGRRISVNLVSAQDLKAKDLVVRLKRGKAKAKKVTFRLRDRGAEVRLTFRAPKRAGTYRVQVFQRTDDGLVRIGSSRMIVRKA